MGEVANDAPTTLLADADVLIDYRESDLDVLKDVGRRVGRLAVLSEVLDEVRGLTRRKCASLGMEVIDVETPTLLAAAEVKAPVSFNDSRASSCAESAGGRASRTTVPCIACAAVTMWNPAMASGSWSTW